MVQLIHCNILTFDQAVNQETGASGRRYHLDLWTDWIRCRCDADKKQVDVNYITRCHRRFELVGVSYSWSSSCCSRQWEPAPDRVFAALVDPRLSSPAEWERGAAIVRGIWGQYVAVCSVSNSPLIHNPFATLPRIKCERYIFLKKCVRSSLLLIMFPHIYVYV